ncbi:DUF397 domain-containing protein [Nocardiopsis sp. FIRDI 009]|uniref:DUF397 domain-containing protein n=1 Tax=Nocardiopsis sp. FIRDI 009 TaxID=714197 RepID=UPI000E243FFB|nr:DUF397 domain-containing protein [Nocardiopsis sp. FIRDI 009]
MYSSTDELKFRKSSYSNPSNCVEVADTPSGDTAVRDSMNPGYGHFLFPGTEWTALLSAVRRDHA